MGNSKFSCYRSAAAGGSKKLIAELAEQLKKDDVSGQQTSITIDDDKLNKLQATLRLSPKHIDTHEQKRVIEIACNCIRNWFPSEMMHTVLQPCPALTRTHSIAVNFLDERDLPMLLSLPTSSLFSGFDNVAATIIRHVLEDPQILQQAMESEIQHSLVAAANRHSNGRVKSTQSRAYSSEVQNRIFKICS